MFDFLIGNDLLSSLIAFGLVLIPAVIVHEFGHFIAAKMVGITVLEFGIGFPPKLFKFGRWRETEFTFNLIPLGGFVRPLGEDMIRTLSAEQTEREREALQQRIAADADIIDERAALRLRGITKLQTVNETKPLPRIWFMAAGAVFNIVAALLLFVLIGLIGIEQRVGTAFLLTDVRPASVLADAGAQTGDAIETVNGEHVADAAAFFAAMEAAQGQPVTLGMLRQNEETGEVTSFEAVIPAGALTGSVTPTYGLLVGDVMAASPAEAAGIVAGDTIVGLNGVSLESLAVPFDTLQDINEANAGQTITIDIIRDGERLSFPVTPRVNPAPGQGYLGAGIRTQTTAAVLGVSYAESEIVDDVPLAFGDAVRYGFNQMGVVFNAIFSLPGRLLSGQASPEEGRVISIVGISQAGGWLLQQSAESGSPYQILNFIALVNIALGLTNLLPLPPLDGGRILFTIIEMMRGKPMSQRREEAIMIAGMVFLLALGVVVILQDIANPILDQLR